MAVGRVLRFDHLRGYGFIAPQDGGEDVFIHANDLVDDKALLEPGVLVEFDVLESGRGLKASGVQIVRQGDSHGRSSSGSSRSGAIARRDGPPDGFCDVLRRGDFSRQATELLLSVEPTLTGAQIVRVRQAFMTFAERLGWVED